MHGREWMKARGWTRILYGEAPELSIPAFGGLKSALSVLTATFDDRQPTLRRRILVISPFNSALSSYYLFHCTRTVHFHLRQSIFHKCRNILPFGCVLFNSALVAYCIWNGERFDLPFH